MNDRFKFRVWAKPHEPTKTEGYYVDEADYVVSWKDGAYTTEKCLGMKNKETGEIKDCSKGGYCFSKHIHQELADDFEVIGNIHENADLIKVGGK